MIDLIIISWCCLGLSFCAVKAKKRRKMDGQPSPNRALKSTIDYIDIDIAHADASVLSTRPPQNRTTRALYSRHSTFLLGDVARLRRPRVVRAFPAFRCFRSMEKKSHSNPKRIMMTKCARASTRPPSTRPTRPTRASKKRRDQYARARNDDDTTGSTRSRGVQTRGKRKETKRTTAS